MVKQTAIYNSIVKYGWDNHIKEILFISLTREEAEEKEIELIKFYKENKKSLNLTDGGFNAYINDINPKSRQVYQYDLDGNFIKEWDSIFDIEVELSLHSTNIGRVCRKKTYYQYGFLWIFKSDVNKGLIPIYNKPLGNRRKKLIVLDSLGNIIKEYASMKEAVANCGLKNARINILICRRKNIPDSNGNYWKSKS